MITKQKAKTTLTNQGQIPPIPPGEKILELNDFGMLFPRFAKDGKTIHGWYFTVGNKQRSSEQYIECLVADASETWFSDLYRISDPDTGKDVGCIIAREHIYVFSYDGTTIHCNKKQRTDNLLGKNVYGVFISTICSDVSVPEKPRQRFLYCLGEIDTQKAPAVFDVNDPTFVLPLPFASEADCQIDACIKLASNCQNYLIIETIHTADSRNLKNSLYVIQEAYLFLLFAQAKPVQINDFSIYDLDAGQYISDYTVGYYYTNLANPGSQQLVMTLAHPDSPNVSLSMFEISTKEELQVLMSHTESLTAIIFPLQNTIRRRKGTLTHFVNPDNSQAFSVMTFGLDTEGQGIRTILLRVSLWYVDAEKKEFVPYDYIRIVYTDLFVSGAFDKKDSDFHATFPGPLFFTCIPSNEWVITDKKYTPNLLGFYIPFRIVRCNFPESAKHVSGYADTRVLFLTLLLKTHNHNGKFVFVYGSRTLPLEIGKGDYTASFDIYNTNLLVANPSLESLSPLQLGYFYSDTMDFLGNSIVVGTPTLTRNDKSIQTIGLYRCIPFDTQTSQTLPSISISTAQTVMTGISKSTHSSWQTGYNVSAHTSLLVFTVNTHFGQSFGGSYLHMKTDQKTIALHSSTGISNTEILHGYGSQFYLWEYPLYRKSLMDKPFDYLSVLVPDGFTDALLDTTDTRFAYDQDYEIGQILTYIDAVKPGYAPKRLWFNKMEFTCTADTQGGGTTLSYSKDNSTHTEEQTSTEDSINAGSSISLSYAGSGVSLSGHYTKHTVKNSATSTTRTDNFTITFHSGSVNDSEYEYTITPIVYTHEKNNMIIITCDIDLTGPSWKKLYQQPSIILMRVYPFTKDPALQHFSRSIRFIENKDASVNININLFNNSFSSARLIVCRVYTGMGIYLPNKDPDISHCKLIDTLKLDLMEGLARKTLASVHKSIPKKTVVTVEVFHDDFEDVTKKIYWGTYPYDAFEVERFSVTGTK